MKGPLDLLLERLNPEVIDRDLLSRHDEAREQYAPVPIRARDHQAFAAILTSYVIHHHTYVGDGSPVASSAFSEARRILEGAYSEDPYQDPYAAALLAGTLGSLGGMRRIIDTIADGIKRRALQEYKDWLFYTYVNVLSPSDNQALAHAYFERFGPLLTRFAPNVDEKTFATNVRAAIEYHLDAINLIRRNARRL